MRRLFAHSVCSNHAGQRDHVIPLRGDLFLQRGDGPLERITETASPEIDPRLSRDGTKVAFVRDEEISPRNTVGKVYIVTTVVTCLTAFGIFQHGGFGKPHALAIITLVVLGAPGSRVLSSGDTHEEEEEG